MNLKLCPECKVIQYCSRSHWKADQSDHMLLCKEVHKSRSRLKRAEQKVRYPPPDWMFPENPFEECVGRFWGLTETRPYLRARLAFVETLLKLKTFEAAESAAKHVRDILRLNRSDNMGVRDVYPALLIRLSRDQEAYNYMQCLLTVDIDGTYGWGNPSVPYLDDIKDADPFGPIEYIIFSECPDLCGLVNMALLKCKIMYDLKQLAKTPVLEEVQPSLPVEIIQRIHYYVASSDIVRNRINAVTADRIPSLEKEIRFHFYTLFRGVNRANRHFWPALGGPEPETNDKFGYYGTASKEEALVKLPWCGDAWKEVPEAIDYVEYCFEIVSKRR